MDDKKPTDRLPTTHKKWEEEPGLKWQCTRCKWEGHVNDIERRRYFVGNEEEPDEWLWSCPDCHSTEHLQEINIPLCRGCEDEFVKDEGDYCGECYQAKLEDQYDQEKDEQLLED